MAVSPWGLVDGALFGLLAWGTSKRYRLAAVASLLLYMVERVLAGQIDAAALPFVILFALGLTNGVRGTYGCRRLAPDHAPTLLHHVLWSLTIVGLTFVTVGSAFTAWSWARRAWIGGRESEATDLFQRVASAVFIVEALKDDGKTTSQGSGVLIAQDEVVTNNHVLESAVSIRVRKADQRWPATVIAVDGSRDLARLRVSGITGMVAAVRSSRTLKTGERVYAVGAPQGLELTLSEGLISGLRPYDDAQLIQTSAPISPGSSGGGLFDSHGRLVGITTLYLKEGQNLNFAVPAEWISLTTGGVVPPLVARRIRNDREYWLGLGREHLEGGRLSEAARAYRKAVWLDSDDPKGWNQLGYTLYRLNLVDEAVTCFREAVRLGPNEAWSHYALGLGLGDLGHHAEAIRELREAIRLEPLDSDSWYRLGRVYARAGYSDALNDAYRQLLKLDRRKAQRLAEESQRVAP